MEPPLGSGDDVGSLSITHPVQKDFHGLTKIQGIFEQLHKGQNAKQLEEKALAVHAEEIARYQKDQKRLEDLVCGSRYRISNS